MTREERTRKAKELALEVHKQACQVFLKQETHDLELLKALEPLKQLVQELEDILLYKDDIELQNSL